MVIILHKYFIKIQENVMFHFIYLYNNGQFGFWNIHLIFYC